MPLQRSVSQHLVEVVTPPISVLSLLQIDAHDLVVVDVLVEPETVVIVVLIHLVNLSGHVASFASQDPDPRLVHT